MIKKSALVPLVVSMLLLSGCISKIPAELVLPDIELTEENSKLENDPAGRFSLRVPLNHRFFLDQEQETARLFRINDGANETVMFFEENLTNVDAAIDLLIGNEEVTEISREDVTINGLTGKKVLVELSTAPGHYTPYYFLQGGKFVYVFSLMRGQVFDHYLGVVKSFTLAGE